ncbi:hypothetical protein JCM14722_12230 [Pseudodesulfovibrio portus]|uniref:Solute-binding protein family 3/N-terminal domain-containing protein n=1 Tax=Pseudodesulfovibrio portus TaxID=231439 RepID=A0ABM8AQJ2_9BACT|nr:hypothetical protein JCM14722_12230 [Pseudodesulfovibrio portus]
MAPRILTLCLCLALLFLPPLPAPAESGVLRVSFNPLPPWKVLGDDGTPGGIDIEFLHLLAKRMDLALDFVQLPFKRGLKMVEHGEIDLMVGVLRRPEREGYAHFLTPPYKNRTNKAVYVLKGREDTITRYEDMRSLVIGTQLGSKYFPRFDSDAAIEKSEVKTIDLNIKMLRAGRIDAFINTEASADYLLARIGLTNVIGKARYAYHEHQDVHMILSKRSPHAYRVAEFDKVMRDLVEHGEFERIKDDFLSRH